MRIILIIVWLVCGFCLGLSGCGASVSANDLQASVHIDNPLIPQAPHSHVGVSVPPPIPERKADAE